MLEEEKGSKFCGLNNENWEIEKVISLSKDLFFDCIKKPHEAIIGVNDTQKYYRDGRIHHTLEETEFVWEFKKEDL